MNFQHKGIFSLIDPKSNVGSNEIKALISLLDGGPDGHQFDAVDNEGNALYKWNKHPIPP